MIQKIISEIKYRLKLCYILANVANSAGATLPRTDCSLGSVLSVVTAEWGGAEELRRYKLGGRVQPVFKLDI